MVADIDAAPLGFALRGASAWLTLNRPQQLNAIDPDMLDALDKALGRIEAEPAILSVVVTGSGRAFCAGADLSALDGLAANEREEASNSFVAQASRQFRRLELLPKPVICALNGLAVAGGTELVLCCDLVIAARSAKIADGHARYGLIPGAGASARLAGRVGWSRAAMLLFTGDSVDADEMRAAGLVNAVVPTEALEAEVLLLCAKINARSPLGLSRMKQLMHAARDVTLDEALTLEQQIGVAHTRSHDRNEGLAAFNARRDPVFLGR